MKKLDKLLVMGFLLLGFAANAIHIKGGWMYYEYLGSSGGKNNYKLVVKVYRDCATPNPGQNDIQINISVFKNADNKLYDNFIAPQTDIYRLEKQSFSECINPKPTVCYVILEYTATISVPDAPEGYTAAFQRCCRINGIVNVAPPSNNYGNTYSIYLPGNEVADGFKNSSPQFAEKDTVAVCFNSDIVLDYSATDPDGDSLVYSFTNAQVGGSMAEPNPASSKSPPYSSILYDAAYAPNNPFGTNVVINPKTGFITGKSPGQTGEYVLAVMIKEYRNGQFIAQTRKELHVNVSACTLASATLPLRITTCDGYTVQFENLSSSAAINSYYWDFGVKNISTDTSTLPVPIYTYADTGVYTAKLVVNRNTSCTDSANTEVRVFPGFKADFTYTGACVTNPFQFIDKSTTKYGKINYWHWRFGTVADDTSSLQNPVFTYPPQISTYTVRLTVASDRGCSDSISKDIATFDKPLLQLPFKDTLICSIDSLMLKAVGNGTFSWSPLGRITNFNTATPIVFPAQTTTYTVTLNDRGCIATDTLRVNVLDFITLDAGPDTTICRKDGVTLRPISQGLQYLWSPGASLDNPKVKNPVASPQAPATTYTVTVNLGKCQASDSVTIRTVPYPVATAGANVSICYGDTAFLSGSISGGTFTWTPANRLLFPNQLQTPAFPLTTTAYVLRAFENLGCPKPGVDTVLVTVIPPLRVFAGNDTTIVIGQPLQLNAVSNGSIFKWTPVTGINNPGISNPVVILDRNSLPVGDEKITYLVNVSTPEGCVTSDDITIRLFKTPPSIFVPNAFTPNQDGKNDVMRPTLAGVKQLLYFRIYNRYGQLVFETKQPGKGWDGNFNGNPQASSAFVYDCEAEDYNGNPLKQSGTFVLVR
jgi:gliding motility-associated-like protein